MATVNHYSYTHYNGTVFPPGASMSWWWGPWDLASKGVVVTAQPFNLSTAYRALEVTDVHVESVPGQVTGAYYVSFVVRNVGQDPIVIYSFSLDLIGP